MHILQLFLSFHLVVVEMPSSLSTSIGFTGGGLPSPSYTLTQFHFHWGNKSDHGSEHDVDGVPYSMEVWRLLYFI